MNADSGDEIVDVVKAFEGRLNEKAAIGFPSNVTDSAGNTIARAPSKLE